MKNTTRLSIIGGLGLFGWTILPDALGLIAEYGFLVQDAPLKGKNVLELVQLFLPVIVVVLTVTGIACSVLISKWRRMIWFDFPLWIANGRWTSAQGRERLRQEGLAAVEKRIKAQQDAAHRPAWRFRMQKWGYDPEHEDWLVLRNDGAGSATEVFVDSLEPQKIIVCHKIPRRQPAAGPNQERWQTNDFGAVSVHVLPEGKEHGAMLAVSYIDETGHRPEPYPVYVHPDHLVPKERALGSD